MDGLVSDFWEFCYPPWDPEDLDERAGKIEWLNKQLPAVIRDIPLTDRASGATMRNVARPCESTIGYW